MKILYESSPLTCSLGNHQINCQFYNPYLVTKILNPYETSIENYSQLYLEYTNSTKYNYGRFLQNFRKKVKTLRYIIKRPLDS